MPEIDQIVTVSIVATSATPTEPNSNTPAIIGYHTHYTDLIRTYSDLAGMVADGFSTTEPLYYLASAIVSQTPHPTTFKVIRATTSVAQTMTFKVTDNQVGDLVGFVVTNPSAVDFNIQHTVTTGQTKAQVATALAAISVTGATLAVDGGDTTQVNVTITASGAIWYPSSIFGGTFHDTSLTAAPGTDLDAVILVDNSWYGLSGTWMSAANISALATWAEANKKFHAATTADTDNRLGTTGISATLKAEGEAYTFVQYTGTPKQYGATGLESQRFTADPGSDSWAYKQIASCTADSLNTNDIGFLAGNNCNFYLFNVAGVNITMNGVMSSGLYADIRRGIDALSGDIQTRIFNLLVSSPKVPYTRKGIAAVCAEVKASLLSFTTSSNGDTAFLSNEAGFEPVVIIPDLTKVNPVDKKSRILKNVNFTCYAQGAIQFVQVNGTVNL